MICNVARPVLTSKILKSLKAVKLLIKPDILSNRHFIKQETISVFFRHFLQRVTKCIKNMGIDASPKRNGIEGGIARCVLMEEGIMSEEGYRILAYA